MRNETGRHTLTPSESEAVEAYADHLRHGTPLDETSSFYSKLREIGYDKVMSAITRGYTIGGNGL